MVEIYMYTLFIFRTSQRILCITFEKTNCKSFIDEWLERPTTVPREIIKCANKNNMKIFFSLVMWDPHGTHMVAMRSRNNFSNESHIVPTWFLLGPTRVPHRTHIVPTCVPCGSQVDFFSRASSWHNDMTSNFFEFSQSRKCITWSYHRVNMCVECVN